MRAAGHNGKNRRSGLAPVLVLCAALAAGAAGLCQSSQGTQATGQTPAAAKGHAKASRTGKSKAGKSAQPAVVAAPVMPVAPPNLLEQPASPATVTVAANQLTVKADNSSLSQILRQVSSDTGMKLNGLTSDERVFGSFGPGRPRDVLTTLLNGTSYNVVMVGDLPNGAPRELLLLGRATEGGGGGSLGSAILPVSPAMNRPNPGMMQPDPNQPPPDDSNGASPDDSGNGGGGNDDGSSDDAPPPMQYTPPSIAPADQSQQNPAGASRPQ